MLARFYKTDWLVLLLGFAIALAALTPKPVLAQDFPALTGSVVDQADLLNPAEEQALKQKLAALEANSNRQLVVATIASLQDYPIEDYGYQLGREWGIGQAANGDAEKDNGVILLIAPNDRKVRIEVGYGLEPILTDALSSRIIQGDILPWFKEGNFPSGINAGVDSISNQLTLPPEEAAQIAQRAKVPANDSDDVPIGLIIFWLAVLIFIILPAIFGSAGKGRRYRGGAGPVIIWGGGGSSWGGGGSSWGSGGGFSGGGGFGGGFSGGGGSFGGGGASGGW